MGCFESKNETYKLTKAEKKIATKYMLRNDFPSVLMLALAIIGIILSFMAIGFGIAAIVFEAPLYFVGVGVWVGPYIFLLELVTIFLSKYSKVK